jgi:outer membrane lipoprotein-sorting protein
VNRRPFLIGGGALALSPFGVLAAPAPGAGDANAHDLMQKNFFVSKIKAFKTSGRMVLINDRGEKRERRTTTFSVLQPNGIDSKLLVKFTYPTDVNGTAFLQVEHIAGEDDEWIFLPALGKSRRLVANNKKDSFVGSDFSYGDISLPNVDLYDHRLLGSEAVAGRDCHKIESTPKSDQTKANSGYSRKITWLRKENFVESKVEYYDLSGRLLKIQLVGDAKLLEPDKGRWFAVHREMANQQTGHRTVIDFDEVSLAASLPEDWFTTRYLERE